ncbi:MAG: hypothetical protein WED04_04155 [Promethearchaeati archaeon SRVP18_Atabeyarchaeia-1]
MQSGKTRLVNELKKLAPTQTVYGWQTKRNRETANLPKTHYFDALCTRNINQKPIRLTGNVYWIRLRRRNIRRTHLVNPMKGGKRQPYNQNKELQGYRKGDLVRTPHGLAYIVGILTSGQLQYQTIYGQIQKRIPKQVKLVESTRGVRFFPMKKEARAKYRFGDQARPSETRVSDA